MGGVVQVSFHLDRLRRAPAALLDAWPTLVGAAAAAARAGARVYVVQAAHADAVLERDGVAFHFVRETAAGSRSAGATRTSRSAPRLAARVGELAPRLLHVHGLGFAGHAQRLKRALPGARLLVQDHADRVPRPWRRLGARRAARSFDAVAFTARAQAEPFFHAGLLPSGLPVHEVLEGSTSFSAGDPAAARAAIGVYGAPCCAWVGRLDANKDPLTVLEGFARAAGRFPDPHLWMCYRDAPLLESVRARIARDPRLTGRVHLLGQLPPEQVESLLRSADVLLQGSFREGSGYGVIEALACGATPIVTDIPSLRVIVGTAGLLWPAGDAAALALRLAAFAELDRAALRAVALEHFDRALSWDAVGRQLARAYRAVLADDPAPAAASAVA